MNTRGGRRTPPANQNGGTSTASISNQRGSCKKRTAAVASSSMRRGLKTISENARTNSDSSSDEAGAANTSSTSTTGGESTAASSPETAVHPKLSANAGKKPTASTASGSNKRRMPPSTSSANSSDATSNTPSKRSRNNSQTSAGSSPQDLQLELRMYGTVKSVLATQYFNVVDRLQLDFQPGCLSNLEYCAQFHSRNGDPPNEIDDYLVRDARNFISEDRPHVFLQFVAKLSVSNEFPGTTLVLSLLELILTVNRPSHAHYTAPFIIESANLLFENITNNFPPCWLDVRDSYKRLLVEKLHIELPKNKYETGGGILKTVLSMLETVLQEEHDDDLVDDPNGSGEYEEYYAWEQKNKQRYLFERLPRDDKLDRVFQVLHLLVKMMEGDLAIWIIRHPKNTSSTMSKPKKMPLIGYFLWPAEECGQINALVKKILNLFVICISIGIADDKVNILARLVNLVSHAINLCDLQPKSGEIIYPNIQTHTDFFALEVKKTIEKVQTCNVDLFLAVIDHLRAPFIQIIAIDQLLMKFNRDVGKPSMKKLFQNFTKKRWRECDEEGSRKLFVHQPDAFNTARYPVYRPLTQKKRTSDIYQTDYLHLLLSSYRSYQLLYQVDVIARLNEKPRSTDAATTPTTTNEDSDDGRLTVPPFPEPGMTSAEYEDHTRTVNKQRQDKFNFAEMEKGVGRLERLAEQSAAHDMAYYARVDCTMNEIVVDAPIVMRYREDVKHYCMLRDLIEGYAEEFGPIFGPWLRAVRRQPVMPPMIPTMMIPTIDGGDDAVEASSSSSSSAASAAAGNSETKTKKTIGV